MSNKLSIQATLQKLIDDAVDEVCAEYDECGSIQTRAAALMDDGERRTVELTVSGEMDGIDPILAEASSAIAAIGAQCGTTIVYLFGQGIDDTVCIFAECRGCSTACLLSVHHKTGMSGDDIVLVTTLWTPDCVLCLCRPTAWAGQVCAFDADQWSQLLAS